MDIVDVPIISIDVPEVRVTNVMSPEVERFLRDSLRSDGVVSPIVVQKRGDRYLLIDGYHRLRALQEMGRLSVPAVVLEGGDRDAVIRNLSLSVIRGRPSISQVRDSIVYLYEECGMGVNDIADRTGLSEKFIDDVLQISELPPEIVDAVDEGRLDKGKALALCKLSDPKSQLYVYEALYGKRLTNHDWEEYVEYFKAHKDVPVNTSSPPPAGVSKSECDVCHAEVESRLMHYVSLCPECLAVVRGYWRVPPSTGVSPASD
jgi:ParB family chromosome partitioning protein